VPVVVFTAGNSRPKKNAQLHTMARSIVVKASSRPSDCSMNRAVPPRVVTDLPLEKQRMLDRLTRSDEDLIGPHGAPGRRRRAQHFCSEQRTRTARDAGI